MHLSEESLNSLKEVLVGLGMGEQVAEASKEDLEQLASFLLNLTAAAIKTRERLRMTGREVPPSFFNDDGEGVVQQSFPGFDI